MSIVAATPYLIVNGQAERALTLYQRALGARVEALMRFGDLDKSCPDGLKQRVMHCELRLGDVRIFLSDGPAEPAPIGSNVQVALNLDDREHTRRVFEALCATGQVIEPLGDAPWGALFGSLRDELGVTWMLNCDAR